MAAFNNGCLLTPLTPSMPTCAPIVDRIETLPVTPPDSVELTADDKSTRVDSKSVGKALHVLATERDALTHLQELYSSSVEAQTALSEAVSLITSSQHDGGKVVFTGVGKSGWIAQKLVATFNSIGIVAVFLHPTEALHGDLGLIRPNDVVMMITFSGKTQELLTLLPHIPTYVPLMVVTSHLTGHTCPLLAHPSRVASCNVLLSAPIHTPEKTSFGLSAPTSSTTVAIALGDSLALAVGDKMHTAPNPSPSDVFLKNHPGGHIGASNTAAPRAEQKMSNIGVRVDELHTVQCAVHEVKCFEVLMAAVRSPNRWVKIYPNHVIAPRRFQSLNDPTANVKTLEDEKGLLMVEHDDWISVPGDCSVEECRQWIVKMRTQGDARGRLFLRPGTILGIVDHESKKSSVIEIEDVVGEDFCGTL